MNEIEKIAERYCIPPELIEEMAQSGGEEFACLDLRTRLIGVRMILGKLFGKEGIICTLTILWVLLVSLVDQISVCHITGEDEDSVMFMMENAGIHPIKVSVAPWIRKEKDK